MNGNPIVRRSEPELTKSKYHQLDQLMKVLLFHVLRTLIIV